MRGLLLVLAGMVLGIAVTLSLPVLAEQDNVFPRSGLPGETYDPGDNVSHFKNGQWFSGPSKPAPVPFQTPPC